VVGGGYRPNGAELLNISQNITWEGKTLPICESYDLHVIGAPGRVTLWKGEEMLANASEGGVDNFRGLMRGIYTIKAGGKSQEVLINGDQTIDLNEKNYDKIEDSVEEIKKNPYRRRPKADILKFGGYRSTPMYRLGSGGMGWNTSLIENDKSDASS
jgi:hypothetical protein